ncbi:MAG: LPP20 family lipoprotein [Bacteriovoracaceae bacterium]|nr:LPP20 family lipoprotein [Bacteriovoracaceae bacterium]
MGRLRAAKFIILSLLTTFEVMAELPKWVQEPNRHCKKYELCAIGEAAGATLAQTRARAAIAKIFETQITSKYSQNLSSNNDESSLRLSEEIIEEVNDAFSGIEIRKNHETNTGIYVLAVLDKLKAARNLRKKIRRLDEKMKTYALDHSAQSIHKLSKLFKKREGLQIRYEFLSNKSIPSPVKFSEIFKKIKKAVSKVVLAIDVKEQGSTDIASFMTSVLSDFGYKFDSKKSTHKVEGELISKQQFMNVKGFQKHKFTLNVEAHNRWKQKSSALTFSVTTIGRDYSQAYAKALPQIKEYIENNITQLNFTTKKAKAK